MNEYSTYGKTQYLNDLNYSKQFIFSFGSNYALGTRLFKKDIREATIFFYAFVRYADELVDNPQQKMPGQTHGTLTEFIQEWQYTLSHEPTIDTHPIIRSNYWLCMRYNIPFSYFDDFLQAMQQDITKSRYLNYAELEHYMWGSAAVVGHIMTFIVGYKNKIAFENARSLGEAMQLANFLRDINEDYQERNRIYIPQQDMTIFAVTEDMIQEQKMTKELKNLVHHYYERADTLFKKGINGIHDLVSGKFSILLASRMYRENIRILRRFDYNIFGKKIRLSRCKKIWILLTTVMIYPFWLLKNK